MDLYIISIYIKYKIDIYVTNYIFTINLTIQSLLFETKIIMKKSVGGSKRF